MENMNEMKKRIKWEKNEWNEKSENKLKNMHKMENWMNEKYEWNEKKSIKWKKIKGMKNMNK